MSEEVNNNLPTLQEAESEVLDNIDPDDRSELSLAVRDNLTEILTAMIESAKGMYLQKTVEKDGLTIPGKVYHKEPDTAVGQYLINQLMGKPKETQVNLGIQNNIIIQWKK
jgi:hypothetical protein